VILSNIDTGAVSTFEPALRAVTGTV